MYDLIGHIVLLLNILWPDFTHSWRWKCHPHLFMISGPFCDSFIHAFSIVLDFVSWSGLDSHKSHACCGTNIVLFFYHADRPWITAAPGHRIFFHCLSWWKQRKSETVCFSLVQCNHTHTHTQGRAGPIELQQFLAVRDWSEARGSGVTQHECEDVSQGRSYR